MTYDVTVDGDGFGLAEAMDLAEAGDTVSLQDGTYEQALETVRDGESGNPITVVGGPGAIIKAQNSASRSVFVGHSFIELKGFTVEGQIGTEVTEDSYVLNCIYVQGPGSDSSTFLDGFVMEEMAVQNCGGECVRLKDGVTNAKIFSNTITNCGIHDYMFESGDMNGQGVCIGTSSDEWPDGEEDVCTNNLVAGNVIDTSANECVDVKEGAYGNVIEDNMCYNQLDINSGCYNSRGNDNIFRNNAGSDCLGAGVRLGGWEVDGFQYGVGNSVYDNDFNDVGFGALKIMVDGQGTICGNTCAGDDCQLIGDYLDDTIDTWDHACYEDDEVTSTSSYYDDDRKTYYSGYDDVTSTSSYNDDDSKTYISAYDDVTSTVSEDNEATTMTVSGDDGVTSTSSYYDNDSKIYSSGYDDVTSTVGGYDEVTSTSSYYDDDSKTYIRGYDDVTSTVDEDDELTTVTVSEDDEVTSTSSYYEEATSTVSEGDNDSGDDDSSDGDSDCDSCDGESSDDDVLGQGYGFAGAMASQ
ncbi:FirrV-1-B30 precursor [Ectocarpus siliculosus]|uniref:FirrV-1-B30 n=1 Tax=Ectocarpus siliculosus TaxID=2880 RepID=D7FZD2_ECTSI|nr:FirrV-1-B30 precursor [Ectocarpus siliculosus]|eukprot:CBJ32749.1 FirrV-1-B30 precursor [Ectocarpus siliculosus]